MKEIYIRDLKTGDEITDFFMIKNLQLKFGSNKKQYLDLLLGDCTGEISGKKWDVTDAELEVLEAIERNDIAKIKAQVTEWNGLRQLKVMKIRKAVSQDETDIRDFIKAAPEEPEEMYKFIKDIAAGSIKDTKLRAITEKFLRDEKDKLLYYPAASKNHHAEMAGLLWHIKRMLMMAERYCEVYTNLSRDLLITGVILHDMEKLTEMISDENGIVSDYSFEGLLLGHIVSGVKKIDKMAAEIGLSEEKTIMLEHMILSHHYEPEYGSPKRPLFPEAEVLHYLDIVDASIYDMEEALDATDKGEFSEKVWTLDNRRLYKKEW